MNLMKDQEYNNYKQIAEVIDNFKQQICLDEIAKKAHLNPSQFEKLFIDWAGVGPEKFLEYTGVQQVKRILSNSPSLFSQSEHKTEPSNKAKLHHLFVQIERMTAEECKNNGENLTINYNFTKTLFGEALVASTPKGICYMGFADDPQIAFSELEKRFSKASLVQKTDDIQLNVLHIYASDWSKIDKIKLHLKGSDFQLKVWESLLHIPMGSLKTYANIAQIIQKPKAARAVGTAIGSNPIAFLIPCHRVVQSSGELGGYMWGTTRKAAIIGWEAANVKL